MSTVTSTAARLACPACGADVTGNYCAQCGQRAGIHVRWLALRNVYRQNALITTGKWLVVSVVYAAFLLSGLSALFLIALLRA